MEKNNTIFGLLKDIQPVTTAHNQGRKYVFLSNTDTVSPITQFAYGKLEAGEACEEHMHPTMEECFFFLSGAGNYIIGETKYSVEAGSFFRIPAGISHKLEAITCIEFIYFGVATLH